MAHADCLPPIVEIAIANANFYIKTIRTLIQVPSNGFDCSPPVVEIANACALATAMIAWPLPVLACRTGEMRVGREKAARTRKRKRAGWQDRRV